MRIALTKNNCKHRIVTGLTKTQKQGLKAKKGNVMSGLFSVEDALESIKPFDDKKDPATLEDVKKFYGLEV